MMIPDEAHCRALIEILPGGVDIRIGCGEDMLEEVLSRFRDLLEEEWLINAYSNEDEYGLCDSLSSDGFPVCPADTWIEDQGIRVRGDYVMHHCNGEGDELNVAFIDSIRDALKGLQGEFEGISYEGTAIESCEGLHGDYYEEKAFGSGTLSDDDIVRLWRERAIGAIEDESLWGSFIEGSIEERLCYDDYDAVLEDLLALGTSDAALERLLGMAKKANEDVYLRLKDRIRTWQGGTGTDAPPMARGEKLERHEEEPGEAMARISMPDGVKEIGRKAFLGNEGITSVVIPDGVERIGDFTFWGCHNLESVRIPASVREIGSHAFYGCGKLSKAEIPKGVTRIGDHAFYGCRSLAMAEIPEGVKEIESHAFFGCGELDKIKVPKGATKIGDYAFCYCGGLERIDIPEGVEEIGSCAFYDCGKLAETGIPKSVTEIGNCAFYGCRSLRKVEIPEGVASIRPGTFRKCEGISIAGCPQARFLGCDLGDVEMREGETYMDSSAFGDVRRLRSLEIPFSMTEIEFTVSEIDFDEFYDSYDEDRAFPLPERFKYDDLDDMLNSVLPEGDPLPAGVLDLDALGKIRPDRYAGAVMPLFRFMEILGRDVALKMRVEPSASQFRMEEVRVLQATEEARRFIICLDRLAAPYLVRDDNEAVADLLPSCPKEQLGRLMRVAEEAGADKALAAINEFRSRES